MNISEGERQKLGEILTSTTLYARAKQQVIEESRVTVQGSSRAIENIALDMAIETGVQAAFDALERLTQAKPPTVGPVTPRSIQKRNPTV